MVARRRQWTRRAALVVTPALLLGAAALVMRADTSGSGSPQPKAAAQSDAALAAQAQRPPDDAGLPAHDTDPAVLQAIAATHPEASGKPEPPTPPGEVPKAGDIPGAWLVQLKPDQPTRDVALEHAQTHHADVTHIYTAAVQGYSANMTDADAAAVAADARVLNVRRDRLVTGQAESIPRGVRRIGGASAASSIADIDVDVAVIDTGISAHPDLNIAGGTNCNGSGTSFADGDGHGTHVAGTIGARNNGSGVVGVAPGARLWAVRVLDNNGNGSLSNVVCGLNWVAARASTIEVANESLGGPGSDGPCSSDIEHQAVCDMVAAGVTDVVAAGNEHANAANSTPAAFDQVITVSALADLDGLTGGLAPNGCGDQDDTFASFSNYGADVDVIAPGVCINSTQPGGGFAVYSGTSMASPHVAGAAALYKARNPGATQADIRTFVTSGTLDWNNSDDHDTIKERLVNVASLWPPETTTTTTPTSTTTTIPGATTTTLCRKGCSTTSTTTGGSTTTTTTTPGSITLSAAKKKTLSGVVVQLLWTNATTSNVDIYRNGTLRVTTGNDGEYSEASPGSGTWSYQVCEEGSTTVCSPVRSVII
jgi:subtilisin family serine protease